MALVSLEQWEEFYRKHRGAHVLQSPQWGWVKAAFGWNPICFQRNESGALILFRRLPFGLSIAYLPKGPLGSGWEDLWPEVDEICRQRRVVFLKVEPDLWEGPAGRYDPLFRGFKKSDFTIQPRRTMIVNLEGGEETWLSKMKQKTRYNIKLAERKEVQVQRSDDLNTFYELALITGKRDGFGVHALAYYQKVYDLFSGREQCALFIAKYGNRPLAGLMALRNGSRAWYLYGASNDEERNRMPAYLIQHAAMKWAFDSGCTEYDLWGIPDHDEDYLESNFSARSDGLWGVYRFKRGFGGKNIRSAGAWDKVYLPAFYRFYIYWMRRRNAQGG